MYLAGVKVGLERWLHSGSGKREGHPLLSSHATGRSGSYTAVYVDRCIVWGIAEKVALYEEGSEEMSNWDRLTSVSLSQSHTQEAHTGRKAEVMRSAVAVSASRSPAHR